MVEAFSTYKGCVFHFLSFMLLYVERPFYKSIYAKILNFKMTERMMTWISKKSEGSLRK